MNTLTSQAYEILKERLITGAFTPGERLQLSKLAVELKMSTTPVREAIMQLASDGYLTLNAGRGAYAMRLDADNVTQMYELREALECYALKRLIQHHDTAYLTALHEHHQTMLDVIQGQTGSVTIAQLEKFSQADEMFHQTLIKSAQSPMIYKHAQECLSQLRLTLLQQQEVMVSTLLTVCDEHEQILIALDKGDPSRMQEALSHHINQSKLRALAKF